MYNEKDDRILAYSLLDNISIKLLYVLKHAAYQTDLSLDSDLRDHRVVRSRSRV